MKRELGHAVLLLHDLIKSGGQIPSRYLDPALFEEEHDDLSERTKLHTVVLQKSGGKFPFTVTKQGTILSITEGQAGHEKLLHMWPGRVVPGPDFTGIMEGFEGFRLSVINGRAMPLGGEHAQTIMDRMTSNVDDGDLASFSFIESVGLIGHRSERTKAADIDPTTGWLLPGQLEPQYRQLREQFCQYRRGAELLRLVFDKETAGAARDQFERMVGGVGGSTAHSAAGSFPAPPTTPPFVKRLSDMSEWQYTDTSSE